MFWIWFLLATSQCALLYILARRGESMPRRIQDEAEANRAVPEDKWPSVGLIVPVAGRDPRMEGALRSLLKQDYPSFVPVLVTAEENEPARAGSEKPWTAGAPGTRPTLRQAQAPTLQNRRFLPAPAIRTRYSGSNRAAVRAGG